VKKLALALVVLLAVALLLLLGELVCRLVTPAGSELAPPRFLVEGRDAAARAALVPGPNPPLPGARFRVEAIPLERPSGTTRLLCLGDSTVHGHPFEPPAPFADWLAARLPRLLEGREGRRFEVWNLGVNASNAERVLDLADELAPLRPDVVVVYVGHNEFLDQWLPGIERPLGHALARRLDRSFLGRRVASWIGRSDAAPPAQLRRRELVHDAPLLSPAELERGERRFGDDLAAIVARVREAGARPLLVLPVCDLGDTPPEWSSFTRVPAGEARERFRNRLQETIGARQELERRRDGDPKSGAERGAAEVRRWLGVVDELAALDPGVARLDFERGRLLRLLGDAEGAKRALVAARDRDGHPIRATSARLETIRRVARENDALLVDPWPLFERAAKDTIPDQQGLFVDYCHPDLKGHRLLAEAILRELARAGAIAATSEWRFDAEPDEAAYESTMGLSRAAQAESLARRGLFLIGQGFLEAANEEPLAAADALFALALEVDGRCALAFTGRGAAALVRRQGERALGEFDRAFEIDPHSLDLIVEKEASVPTVKELFEANGLTVRAGRVERR
jgi:lysophospholipase L1-like esterase